MTLWHFVVIGKAAVEEVTSTGIIQMCSVLYYVMSLQQMIHILLDELGGGGVSRQCTRMFLM